jgi:site-specific DNA-methyltransferase (adenine-specific)
MNSIVLGDARDLSNYPDTKYHLTITSPPYFVGKEYEEDYTFDDYREMLQTVFHNTAERTVEGGKIAINIADIAAFSKVSGRVEENTQVSREIVANLAEDDCHLLARYIWHKDDPWQNSQHVGYSDKIPATYVRALPNWEYIWVFYKGTPKREDVPSIIDVISKEDWKRWVSAVWKIKSVHSNDFHEAMFPEELVRRLVKFYSIPGDVVFDPFMGSGTTAVVAYKNGRNYAGIERDEEYHELSVKNLELVENCLERQYVPYVPPARFKQNRVL